MLTENGKRQIAFLFLGLCLCCCGCVSRIAELQRVNQQDSFDQRFLLNTSGSPKNSERTLRTLRMYDLETSQVESVRELAKILKKYQENPSADLLVAYLETAYCTAVELELTDSRTAAEIFVSVALYSYYYLFETDLDRERKLYDSQIRDVCQFYNGALYHILQMQLNETRNLYMAPGEKFALPLNPGEWTFTCQLVTGHWLPDEIDHFKLASDYKIKDLANEYRQEGLGVPLIAQKSRRKTGKKEELYYPDGLCFPVTAFLRPLYKESGTCKYDVDAILEFYDPLISPCTSVDGKKVPLESDLTTPLACMLHEMNIPVINTIGFVRPQKLLEKTPDNSRSVMGLYMIQPYEPDKIPVIMVHGLWSSPMTWIDMFNTLRSIDEMRENYQFWFYFYPSGQPFWVSSAQLRDDLAKIREDLDPNHLEPKLDEMVLIGHSMGGLVSRMQVLSSGNEIWKEISDTPIQQIDLPEKTRSELVRWFFFEPNPSIRRVITIATPFKGSDKANDLTKWFADLAIAVPSHISSALTDLLKSKDRPIKDERLLKAKTSVDSLSPECPIFDAMNRCTPARNVAFNNIKGLLSEKDRKFLIPKGGDGVVDLESAALKDAQSEKTISAEHVIIHAHPAAILETRRILSEHLFQMRVERQAKSTCIADEANNTPDLRK